MADSQLKYYGGCKQSSRYSGNPNDIMFYKDAKLAAKKSILAFIKNNELNISMLSSYLDKSQQNKVYMLYKDGVFHLERKDPGNYNIKSHIQKKNTYIATTGTGTRLKILLRWKNGNGIAFTAFQIKCCK
jgi:frataxin-like iron-binding protein CyaY